jgi:serine/threonine-protein kinase
MDGMDTTLPAGELVAGTYRIVKELGAGTMGVVYLATDVALGRRVALKMMRPGMVIDRGLAGQFEIEARALAGVQHPNVVQIYAFGTTDSAQYFAMEYVDGEDLRTWFRRRGRHVAPRAAIDIIAQIADGLHGLHAAGFVHRDLKPSNILITRARHVAVADLGLCRSVAALDDGTSGAIVGTPAFVAPEVVQGLGIRPELASRIDVYALAILAYELLTGQRPFRGGDLGQTMQAHVESAPNRASAVRPSLPRSVDAVFARGLAKDPARRQKTAPAFASALRDALEAEVRDESPHVLVVDDDEDHRTMVMSWLLARFPNARVDEASDGEEALVLMDDEGDPDLLVADLHMPRLGGAGLVARLHESDRTRDVRIVVVTGAGGARDWQELRSFGVETFHLKPIDRVGFIATIERLLHSEPTSVDAG